MCVGSRRGSSDSYYRELGEQDTLKIDDKSSLSLEESEEPGRDLESLPNTLTIHTTKE
ncbi:unnamed protein product [Plutella xylostella]|uniref:(diamondback moth) hypothetical protein n=1 Tax=Plutella xylostella TaxID=51655 RepID=A0A8S4GB15_PLUXY|nr:unnamed protein product [Plutella xylostella]